MNSAFGSLAAMAVDGTGGGTGAGWLAGGVGIVFVLISIAVFIFWLWMLIDCVSSSMPSGEKILWFLVIFFLPLIGSLIYFFIRRGGTRGSAVP